MASQIIDFPSTGKRDGYDTKDERIIAERMREAYFMTRMAELDIYEQVLEHMGNAVLAEEGLFGLSKDDRAKLTAIRQKVMQHAALDPAEQIVLDRAAKHSEQLGKRLGGMTLRMTAASRVQLLTIKAHSPVYDPDRQLKAMKMLIDMANRDVMLSKAITDELLSLTLSNAYAKVAELFLIGELTKEQSDHALKLLDHRMAAAELDLKAKYLGREGEQPQQAQANPHAADGYEPE